MTRERDPVSRSDKPDILDWFGLRASPTGPKARWLGPLLSGVVALLFVMAVLVAGPCSLHALVGLDLDARRASASAPARWRSP